MSRLASEANREAAAQPERSKGSASGRHDSSTQPGSPGGSLKACSPRTAVAAGADLEVTRRVGSAPRSAPGREGLNAYPAGAGAGAGAGAEC